MNFENLTEEEIQKQLANGPVRGRLQFREKPLADYTAGLRDLMLKVLKAEDTSLFHDIVLIYVLSEAYGVSDEDQMDNRIRLIVATDNSTAFRAAVSITFADKLSDEEIAEIRNLADTILTPVILASVIPVTQKKSALKATRNAARTPMLSS